MSTQPWTNVHLPLNFHFPDTKHVKHKYIYLRYPWDPEFRITEKENIPIGTITNSSLKLHTDFDRILAIQYNGVIASHDPLRFAYQVSHRLAGLWGGSLNIYYISEAISTAQDLLCI